VLVDASSQRYPREHSDGNQEHCHLNEANPETQECEDEAEGNKDSCENKVSGNEAKQSRKELFKRIHRY
jgi:hypothetical protein